MTREERIAAGWVECWGRFDWSDMTWCQDNGGYAAKPTKRMVFGSFHAANSTGCDDTLKYLITARRFWRRRKPKAQSPLEVGDAVWVRARVAADVSLSGCGNAAIGLQWLSGNIQTCYVRPSDVERVKP